MGLTSSNPSLSAAGPVSSPASRLPLGKNHQLFTLCLHTTTRAVARWNIATPAATVILLQLKIAVTGALEVIFVAGYETGRKIVGA